MAEEKRGGLLGRVGRRVKGGLSKVKGGLKAIAEEAQYPGRPPGFRAADSPFWQDPDVVAKAHAPAPPPASEAAAAPSLPKPTDSTDRDGEPFWFLEGGADLEGWDQTNPSEAWRQRHGVDEGEG